MAKNIQTLINPQKTPDNISKCENKPFIRLGEKTSFSKTNGRFV